MAFARGLIMPIILPAEYKKSQGLNYKSGLKGAGQALWKAFTIQNILTNPVYTGVLIQGKRGTPNYKVKQMRVRDEDQWSIVNDNHEAIIDEFTFKTVQKVLSKDTRVSAKADAVVPLSATERNLTGLSLNFVSCVAFSGVSVEDL